MVWPAADYCIVFILELFINNNKEVWLYFSLATYVAINHFRNSPQKKTSTGMRPATLCFSFVPRHPCPGQTICHIARCLHSVNFAKATQAHTLAAFHQPHHDTPEPRQPTPNFEATAAAAGKLLATPSLTAPFLHRFVDAFICVCLLVSAVPPRHNCTSSHTIAAQLGPVHLLLRVSQKYFDSPRVKHTHFDLHSGRKPSV